MYEGKNVEAERNHQVWSFPLVYFYRRTFFVLGTVFLFDYPSIQMMLHQLLSLAMLAYLLSDHYMYTWFTHRFVEISTEALLLLVSTLMQ